LRYCKSMTGLLETALRRVESLSREEQDAIASQIMETLDDDEAWARSFRERPALLRSLAREALEEHRRGETRPLDELIGPGCQEDGRPPRSNAAIFPCRTSHSTASRTA
jgi:hypothetical protein